MKVFACKNAVGEADALGCGLGVGDRTWGADDFSAGNNGGGEGGGGEGGGGMLRALDVAIGIGTLAGNSVPGGNVGSGAGVGIAGSGGPGYTVCWPGVTM